MPLLLILFSFLLVSTNSNAVDVVKFSKARFADDPRMPYKYEVLKQALIATEDKYGPFVIEQTSSYRMAPRAIIDIQSGKEINIFMAVSTPEWEEKSIPIRIPLKRGILNYRLLAIKDNQQNEFSPITQEQRLKEKLLGVRQGWITNAILKHHGYNVFDVSTVDGLFAMLAHGRLDYIPLGVNEIDEFIKNIKPSYNNIMVEKTLALYITSPFYIFVSPKTPRIAQRLQAGLEIMIANGTFKKIFYRYYGDILKNSALLNRTIIEVKNPYLPVNTQLKRKELWFEFDEEFKKL